LARRCDACMPGRQCAQDLVALIVEDACNCDRAVDRSSRRG
jgi:hypothetical protein